MIIRHSLEILEQLSEIENLIQKIENYANEKGIKVDGEKLLEKLVINREASSTSRSHKEN